MLITNYSSRFKKELKLMEKRGLDIQKILDIISDLENEVPLKSKHREHLLQGNYEGYLECHVEPDWLLIYKINKITKKIYFARTGTHTDLFT